MSDQQPDPTSTPTAPIRVAIADDHPVVREGLVTMLRAQPDFEVVGEAGTGPDALTLVRDRTPEVLLLDLELPGLDGVGVLRALRASGAPVRTIVFTVFDTDERIIAAVEAGAAGYLLKGVPRAEIFNAIRVVRAGGSLLQPVVASTVVRHVVASGRSEARSSVELTPRERSVLELLGRGMSNKEIAAQLRASERTIKFHVSAIFSKLGATNRTEAVTRAVRAGMITLE